MTSSEQGDSGEPRRRLVLGTQPVREAIRAHGGALLEVLVQTGVGKAAARLDALARFASDRGVARVRRCSADDLDRIARGTTHQGAAAYAPPLTLAAPSELVLDPGLVAVALDGVQDPQNFGATVRSAVAVARAAVVWPESASAPLSPATFRASAGAIEHATLCRVPSLRDWLIEAGSRGAMVVGLDASADAALETLPLQAPLVIVIGSEHRGLSRAVRGACTHLARLAQAG